jgi:hypothetical protein
MTPETLEIELRELAHRLQNVMSLVAKGHDIDHKLVIQLITVSLKCDEYFTEHQTIDPSDIELMNDLISMIELTSV